MSTAVLRATEAAAGPQQQQKGGGDRPLPTHVVLCKWTARTALFANKFSKCQKSAALHLIGNDSAFCISHLKRCNYTSEDETLAIL